MTSVEHQNFNFRKPEMRDNIGAPAQDKWSSENPATEHATAKGPITHTRNIPPAPQNTDLFLSRVWRASAGRLTAVRSSKTGTQTGCTQATQPVPVARLQEQLRQQRREVMDGAETGDNGSRKWRGAGIPRGVALTPVACAVVVREREGKHAAVKFKCGHSSTVSASLAGKTSRNGCKVAVAVRFDFGIPGEPTLGGGCGRRKEDVCASGRKEDGKEAEGETFGLLFAFGGVYTQWTQPPINAVSSIGKLNRPAVSAWPGFPRYLVIIGAEEAVDEDKGMEQRLPEQNQSKLGMAWITIRKQLIAQWQKALELLSTPFWNLKHSIIEFNLVTRNRRADGVSPSCDCTTRGIEGTRSKLCERLNPRYKPTIPNLSNSPFQLSRNDKLSIHAFRDALRNPDKGKGGADNEADSRMNPFESEKKLEPEHAQNRLKNENEKKFSRNRRRQAGRLEQNPQPKDRQTQLEHEDDRIRFEVGLKLKKMRIGLKSVDYKIVDPEAHPVGKRSIWLQTNQATRDKLNSVNTGTSGWTAEAYCV
ncbi:hypothetical protein C8R43DRAFT_959469 [Mycena crocata]|nr:hypothetical protein C8R43DRAFT_959469 [Mycena crocata]